MKSRKDLKGTISSLKMEREKLEFESLKFDLDREQQGAD